MRQEYIEELEVLKIKMGEAEKFAKKLPIFSEQILKNKYNGNEDWIRFGEKYKDIYLGWGIDRGLYKSDTTRTINNYRAESYTEFLFKIYINTYSLFDNTYGFGLESATRKIPVFFYDKLNSTFYVTDEQITELLEKLNEWYLKAREENIKLSKQKKIEEAKEKIKEAKEEIEFLQE